MYKVNASLNVPGGKPFPILIGALMPKMLELCGELCDGTLTWMSGPKHLATSVVPILQRASKAAKREMPRVICSLPVCVTDDVEGAKQQAQKLFGHYGFLPVYRACLDAEGAAGPIDVALIGPEKQVQAGLERVRDAGAERLLRGDLSRSERRRFDGAQLWPAQVVSRLPLRVRRIVAARPLRGRFRPAVSESSMTGWVTTLRVFAALIAVRALTNLFKPFGAGNAFVFFGQKLTSPAGMWLAALVGVLMLVYAWGAWSLRRWSLPMAVAYALFVALNIPLFVVFNGMPERGFRVVGLLFLLIGVGVTSGAAYLLWAHRNELA
jgi:hypothetical protein